MTEQEFELIERYVQEEMLTVEKISFEKRLSIEPQLQDKVDEVSAIIVAAKRAEIKSRIAKARQEDLLGRREAKVTKLSSRRVLSIAAGFLILAVVGFSLSKQWWSQQPNQLANAYFEPAIGLPTTLGISSNSAFLEGMIDYKLGDYSSAIGRWGKLQGDGKSSDTLNYYLGVAQLANHQPSIALDVFSKIPSSSKLWSNTQWYSALSYLDNDQVEKAKVLLDSLSKHPGTFRARAADLRSKL